MKKGKDGYYRSAITIGYDADGKPIRKHLCGKTEKELLERREAAKAHFISGEPIPEDKPFYEYALEWYTVKKEPFISPSSQKGYRSCLMKYVLPEFGLQRIRAIQAKQVQEFVTSFKGMSKSQITMVIGILKGIFRSALAEGVIDRDPSAAIIRPKSKRKDERRALTKEETAAVLKAIDTEPEGLFLAVLYYLGLRKGEALGLKWGDFNFNEDYVYIQRDIDFTQGRAYEDSLKTEAAERYVPVPEELKIRLLPQMGKRGEYVFHTRDGRPLPQATVKRMWIRLMLACGCVEWRDPGETVDRREDITKQLKPTLTAHYFRHNYITLLYESGVDPLAAMKIVGHRDYQTTANIYTHLKDEAIRKASVNLNKVFGSTTMED